MTRATDPLEQLLALRQRPTRTIVGLISGTSADGIDAALVEVSGQGLQTTARLICARTTELDRDLARRIWSLPDERATALCSLNFLLGEAFATAVREVAEAAGVPLEQLDLVGSHGQTARHEPPAAGRRGSTLQIGEGAVIAERTGLPVICDFRVADVAAGGHGAPLIPLVDYLLFAPPRGARLLLNLGGIANVTVVTPRIEDVVAFDTGPANMALDAVARAASDGRHSYDAGGALAAAGTVDDALLAELLSHPYFAAAPPKSTGRETFGRDFVYPLLDRYRERHPDLMATLLQLTVESIARACEEHIYPGVGAVEQLLVAGGGVHNETLMRHLARRLAPLPVTSVASFGIDPDAKEALAFAVLANQALFCEPGNVPRATGAAGPRVLGKLVLPPL